MTSLAFAPSGRTLAAVAADHTIQLWQATDPRHLVKAGTVVGHADIINSLAISADDGTLATASDDHTIRLWDIADPRRPVSLAVLAGHAVLSSHTATIRAIAFAPDGRHFATAGTDHTARLWDADLREIAERTCLHPHHILTTTQWSQYFPGIPYDPPCR